MLHLLPEGLLLTSEQAHTTLLPAKAESCRYIPQFFLSKSNPLTLGFGLVEGRTTKRRSVPSFSFSSADPLTLGSALVKANMAENCRYISLFFLSKSRPLRWVVILFRGACGRDKAISVARRCFPHTLSVGFAASSPIGRDKCKCGGGFGSSNRHEVTPYLFTITYYLLLQSAPKAFSVWIILAFPSMPWGA